VGPNVVVVDLVSGYNIDNRMGHINGEIRDRELCMRTLERSDTPILSGMRIQAAGIRVEGENKWLTLIQNASKNSSRERLVQ